MFWRGAPSCSKWHKFRQRRLIDKRGADIRAWLESAGTGAAFRLPPVRSALASLCEPEEQEIPAVQGRISASSRGRWLSLWPKAQHLGIRLRVCETLGVAKELRTATKAVHPSARSAHAVQECDPASSAANRTTGKPPGMPDRPSAARATQHSESNAAYARLR